MDNLNKINIGDLVLLHTSRNIKNINTINYSIKDYLHTSEDKRIQILLNNPNGKENKVNIFHTVLVGFLLLVLEL